MKNVSGTLLHFSGYPLSVAEKKLQPEKIQQPALSVIRPEFPSRLPKSDMANNPKNWDESWFCNYE
ncbi:MAG: hypothetical protein ACXVMS_13700 [Flavisolibacter sp.]